MSRTTDTLEQVRMLECSKSSNEEFRCRGSETLPIIRQLKGLGFDVSSGFEANY